jgi:hypothetical protein
MGYLILLHPTAWGGGLCISHHISSFDLWSDLLCEGNRFTIHPSLSPQSSAAPVIQLLTITCLRHGDELR